MNHQSGLPVGSELSAAHAYIVIEYVRIHRFRASHLLYTRSIPYGWSQSSI